MKTPNTFTSLFIVLFIFLLNTSPINAQTTDRYTEPARELFYPVQQPSLSKTITSLKIQQRFLTTTRRFFLLGCSFIVNYNK